MKVDILTVQAKVEYSDCFKFSYTFNFYNPFNV